MGGLVTAITGGKPKQDTSQLEMIKKREKAAEEEKRRLQQQSNARVRASRSGGRRSLLSGLETGVKPTEGTREQLG